MAGFGTAPIGSTPFGFGTPVAATPPPSVVPEAANYVNFRTRDYEVDGENELRRMPISRHRVLMLLSTRLGSAAHLPTIGLRLPSKIGQSFQQEVDQAVRDALAPIGADIRIDGVTAVTTIVGRAEITVSFTDLTTGNSETVTI